MGHRKIQRLTPHVNHSRQRAPDSFSVSLSLSLVPRDKNCEQRKCTAFALTALMASERLDSKRTERERERDDGVTEVIRQRRGEG